jgi:hypothetical protein
MDSQQLFLDLTAAWICSCPAKDHRCDAAAAMSLACVAHNPRRHALSAWAWRSMRACEIETIRIMDAQTLHFRDRLSGVLDNYSLGSANHGRSIEGRLWRTLAESLQHLGILTRLLIQRPRLRAAADALIPEVRSILQIDEMLEEVASDLSPDGSEHSNMEVDSDDES